MAENRLISSYADNFSVNGCELTLSLFLLLNFFYAYFLTGFPSFFKTERPCDDNEKY